MVCGSLDFLVKDRFFSFTLMLGTGFLLLVSLIISAGLAAMGEFFTGLLAGGEVVLQIVNFVVSLAVITALFALIFKYIPDAEIAWGDVWIGASARALLFTVGKTGDLSSILIKVRPNKGTKRDT